MAVDVETGSLNFSPQCFASQLVSSYVLLYFVSGTRAFFSLMLGLLIALGPFHHFDKWDEIQLYRRASLFDSELGPG